MNTVLSYEDVLSMYVEHFGVEPIFDVTEWAEDPDRIDQMLAAIDNDEPLQDSNEDISATY